jgi:hypothetical protein
MELKELKLSCVVFIRTRRLLVVVSRVITHKLPSVRIVVGHMAKMLLVGRHRNSVVVDLDNVSETAVKLIQHRPFQAQCRRGRGHCLSKSTVRW